MVVPASIEASTVSNDGGGILCASHDMVRRDKRFYGFELVLLRVTVISIVSSLFLSAEVTLYPTGHCCDVQSC